MSAVPEGFLHWKDVPSSYKKFIKENVPDVVDQTDRTYIADATVKQQKEVVSFSYASFDVTNQVSGKMKGTTNLDGSASLKTSSWYTYTFVFIEASEKPGQFYVYTPIAKPNLRLWSDTSADQVAQFSSSRVNTEMMLCTYPPLGDRGTDIPYQWLTDGTDGNKLQLDWNRGHDGTMKFTSTADSMTQFVFSAPPVPDDYRTKGSQPLSEFQSDIIKKIEDVVQELGIEYQFINLAKMDVITARDTSVPVQVDEATGKLMTANPGDPASVFVFVRMWDGSDVVLHLESGNNVYLQKGQSGDSSAVFKSLKEWKQGGDDAARIKYDISPHNGAIAYKMKEQAASLYLALNGNTITYGEEGAVFTFHHGTDAVVTESRAGRERSTCAIL